jgi:hypothetical protein
VGKNWEKPGKTWEKQHFLKVVNEKRAILIKKTAFLHQKTVVWATIFKVKIKRQIMKIYMSFLIQYAVYIFA